jgi:hypothetical protein
MRATEIIRGVLDLIDQVECAQQPADMRADSISMYPNYQANKGQ